MPLTAVREKSLEVFGGRYRGNNAYNAVKNNPTAYGLVLSGTLKYNRQLIGSPIAIEQATKTG